MTENTKCQNEGCGAYDFCDKEPTIAGVLVCIGDMNDHECAEFECINFTTTPTTSISTAELKELRADKERLDWLIEECYLPDAHPGGGVFMVVDEKSLSFGSYTGRTEEDRAAVRSSIDKAMTPEALKDKP